MNRKLRDKMYKIFGMIEALRFPTTDVEPPFYDLIESIAAQYEDVLKELADD